MELNSLTHLSALSIIFVDRRKLCCFLPEVPSCIYTTNDMPLLSKSSCADLLSSKVMSVLIWIQSILVMIPNSVVVLFWITGNRLNIPSIGLVSLAFSDGIVGLYLIVIATADIVYRADYIVNEQAWTSGCLLYTSPSPRDS